MFFPNFVVKKPQEDEPTPHIKNTNHSTVTGSRNSELNSPEHGVGEKENKYIDKCCDYSPLFGHVENTLYLLGRSSQDIGPLV